MHNFFLGLFTATVMFLTFASSAFAQGANQYSCFWAGGVGCNIRQDTCQSGFEAGSGCSSLTKTQCDAGPTFDCVAASNCGTDGTRCCKNNSKPCGDGLFCQVSSDTCKPSGAAQCGGLGQSCCTGNSCPNGNNLTCVTGICSGPPCGRIGETCCQNADPANQCYPYPTISCDSLSNTCKGKCGGFGEVCCQNRKCDTGIECDGNLCNKRTCGDLLQSCCGGATKCFRGGCDVITNKCSLNPQTEKFEGECITKENERGYDSAIGCVPVAKIINTSTFVLRWAIGIGGGIAVLLIIYSGIIIITSTGDPKRLQAGQTLLTSAIGGLLIIIFSVFILRFLGMNVLGIL